MNKETMPYFSKCVTDKNGEVWCWDSIKKTVCRVIPVDKAVPPDVLFDLLKATNENE